MQKIQLLKYTLLFNYKKYLIFFIIYFNLIYSIAQDNKVQCLSLNSLSWSNCIGSYTTTIGNDYIGEFKNGKKHGKGILIFKAQGNTNGDKYIGEWSEDKPNGWGIYFFANGSRYEGEFKDGKRHGIGVYLKNDAQLGIGEWKNNKPHGQFAEYLAVGNIKNSGVFDDGILIKNQQNNSNVYFNYIIKNISFLVDYMQNNLNIKFLYDDKISLYNQDGKKNQDIKNKNLSISISTIYDNSDSNGIVTINIQSNVETSSLKINGEELGGKADGRYSVKKITRIGQETKFTITGVDINGNTDTKTVTVFRQAVDSKAVIGQLNATNVKQQPLRDAVAIIIGIEKYKRVSRADYANADAQDFYDYSNRALGIKPENIKLLVDDGADDVEILQAFQNWLPLKVKKGKTDVYVFFSGHGYPSEDGKGLYFLPYGVDKNYMDRTAVKQKELVTALQSVQPKSVTMFIDSCYSGQTRGGDTLVAGSKPIALKQSETAYPSDFTVITASTFDQISWSSPELKHGIFSYYLMKGMEGDADMNKDGKITVAEMQEYLTDMVGRQAMGMNRKQQPQLFGDPDRVLVGK